MSAMPGFAMESSANGTSLSTTTARFIGTLSRDAVPFLTTRKVFAWAEISVTSAKGLMHKDSYLAEQGHWMGRPGQARVTRMGPVDAMTGVHVAGQAFVLMSGRVALPDHL